MPPREQMMLLKCGIIFLVLALAVSSTPARDDRSRKKPGPHSENVLRHSRQPILLTAPPAGDRTSAASRRTERDSPPPSRGHDVATPDNRTTTITIPLPPLSEGYREVSTLEIKYTWETIPERANKMASPPTTMENPTFQRDQKLTLNTSMQKSTSDSENGKKPEIRSSQRAEKTKTTRNSLTISKTKNAATEFSGENTTSVDEDSSDQHDEGEEHELNWLMRTEENTMSTPSPTLKRLAKDVETRATPTSSKRKHDLPQTTTMSSSVSSNKDDNIMSRPVLTGKRRRGFNTTMVAQKNRSVYDKTSSHPTKNYRLLVTGNLRRRVNDSQGKQMETTTMPSPSSSTTPTRTIDKKTDAVAAARSKHNFTKRTNGIKSRINHFEDRGQLRSIQKKLGNEIARAGNIVRKVNTRIRNTIDSLPHGINARSRHNSTKRTNEIKSRMNHLDNRGQLRSVKEKHGNETARAGNNVRNVHANTRNTAARLPHGNRKKKDTVERSVNLTENASLCSSLHNQTLKEIETLQIHSAVRKITIKNKENKEINHKVSSKSQAESRILPNSQRRVTNSGIRVHGPAIIQRQDRNLRRISSKDSHREETGFSDHARKRSEQLLRKHSTEPSHSNSRNKLLNQNKIHSSSSTNTRERKLLPRHRNGNTSRQLTHTTTSKLRSQQRPKQSIQGSSRIEPVSTRRIHKRSTSATARFGGLDLLQSHLLEEWHGDGWSPSVPFDPGMVINSQEFIPYQLAAKVTVPHLEVIQATSPDHGKDNVQAFEHSERIKTFDISLANTPHLKTPKKETLHDLPTVVDFNVNVNISQPSETVRGESEQTTTKPNEHTVTNSQVETTTISVHDASITEDQLAVEKQEDTVSNVTIDSFSEEITTLPSSNKNVTGSYVSKNGDELSRSKMDVKNKTSHSNITLPDEISILDKGDPELSISNPHNGVNDEHDKEINDKTIKLQSKQHVNGDMDNKRQLYGIHSFEEEINDKHWKKKFNNKHDEISTMTAPIDENHHSYVVKINKQNQEIANEAPHDVIPDDVIIENNEKLENSDTEIVFKANEERVSKQPVRAADKIISMDNILHPDDSKTLDKDKYDVSPIDDGGDKTEENPNNGTHYIGENIESNMVPEEIPPVDDSDEDIDLKHIVYGLQNEENDVPNNLNGNDTEESAMFHMKNINKQQENQDGILHTDLTSKTFNDSETNHPDRTVESHNKQGDMLWIDNTDKIIDNIEKNDEKHTEKSEKIFLERRINLQDDPDETLPLDQTSKYFDNRDTIYPGSRSTIESDKKQDGVIRVDSNERNIDGTEVFYPGVIDDMSTEDIDISPIDDEDQNTDTKEDAEKIFLEKRVNPQDDPDETLPLYQTSKDFDHSDTIYPGSRSNTHTYKDQDVIRSDGNEKNIDGTEVFYPGVIDDMSREDIDISPIDDEDQNTDTKEDAEKIFLERRVNPQDDPDEMLPLYQTSKYLDHHDKIYPGSRYSIHTYKDQDVIRSDGNKKNIDDTEVFYPGVIDDMSTEDIDMSPIGDEGKITDNSEDDEQIFLERRVNPQDITDEILPLDQTSKDFEYSDTIYPGSRSTIQTYKDQDIRSDGNEKSIDDTEVFYPEDIDDMSTEEIDMSPIDDEDQNTDTKEDAEKIFLEKRVNPQDDPDENLPLDQTSKDFEYSDTIYPGSRSTIDSDEEQDDVIQSDGNQKNIDGTNVFYPQEEEDQDKEEISMSPFGNDGKKTNNREETEKIFLERRVDPQDDPDEMLPIYDERIVETNEEPYEILPVDDNNKSIDKTNTLYSDDADALDKEEISISPFDTSGKKEGTEKIRMESLSSPSEKLYDILPTSANNTNLENDEWIYPENIITPQNKLNGVLKKHPNENNLEDFIYIYPDGTRESNTERKLPTHFNGDNVERLEMYHPERTGRKIKNTTSTLPIHGNDGNGEDFEKYYPESIREPNKLPNEEFVLSNHSNSDNNLKDSENYYSESTKESAKNRSAIHEIDTNLEDTGRFHSDTAITPINKPAVESPINVNTEVIRPSEMDKSEITVTRTEQQNVFSPVDLNRKILRHHVNASSTFKQIDDQYEDMPKDSSIENVLATEQKDREPTTDPIDKRNVNRNIFQSTVKQYETIPTDERRSISPNTNDYRESTATPTDEYIATPIDYSRDIFVTTENDHQQSTTIQPIDEQSVDLSVDFSRKPSWSTEIVESTVKPIDKEDVTIPIGLSRKIIRPVGKNEKESTTIPTDEHYVTAPPYFGKNFSQDEKEFKENGDIPIDKQPVMLRTDFGRNHISPFEIMYKEPNMQPDETPTDYSPTDSTGKIFVPTEKIYNPSSIGQHEAAIRAMPIDESGTNREYTQQLGTDNITKPDEEKFPASVDSTKELQEDFPALNNFSTDRKEVIKDENINNFQNGSDTVVDTNYGVIATFSGNISSREDTNVNDEQISARGHITDHLPKSDKKTTSVDNYHSRRGFSEENTSNHRYADSLHSQGEGKNDISPVRSEILKDNDNLALNKKRKILTRTNTSMRLDSKNGRFVSQGEDQFEGVPIDQTLTTKHPEVNNNNTIMMFARTTIPERVKSKPIHGYTLPREAAITNENIPLNRTLTTNFLRLNTNGTRNNKSRKFRVTGMTKQIKSRNGHDTLSRQREIKHIKIPAIKTLTPMRFKNNRNGSRNNTRSTFIRANIPEPIRFQGKGKNKDIPTNQTQTTNVVKVRNNLTRINKSRMLTRTRISEPNQDRMKNDKVGEIGTIINKMKDVNMESNTKTKYEEHSDFLNAKGERIVEDVTTDNTKRLIKPKVENEGVIRSTVDGQYLEGMAKNQTNLIFPSHIEEPLSGIEKHDTANIIKIKQAYESNFSSEKEIKSMDGMNQHTNEGRKKMQDVHDMFVIDAEGRTIVESGKHSKGRHIETKHNHQHTSFRDDNGEIIDLNEKHSTEGLYVPTEDAVVILPRDIEGEHFHGKGQIETVVYVNSKHVNNSMASKDVEGEILNGIVNLPRVLKTKLLNTTSLNETKPFIVKGKIINATRKNAPAHDKQKYNNHGVLPNIPNRNIVSNTKNFTIPSYEHFGISLRNADDVEEKHTVSFITPIHNDGIFLRDIESKHIEGMGKPNKDNIFTKPSQKNDSIQFSGKEMGINNNNSHIKTIQEKNNVHNSRSSLIIPIKVDSGDSSEYINIKSIGNTAVLSVVVNNLVTYNFVVHHPGSEANNMSGFVINDNDTHSSVKMPVKLGQKGSTSYLNVSFIQDIPTVSVVINNTLVDQFPIGNLDQPVNDASEVKNQPVNDASKVKNVTFEDTTPIDDIHTVNQFVSREDNSEKNDINLEKINISDIEDDYVQPLEGLADEAPNNVQSKHWQNPVRDPSERSYPSGEVEQIRVKGTVADQPSSNLPPLNPLYVNDNVEAYDVLPFSGDKEQPGLNKKLADDVYQIELEKEQSDENLSTFPTKPLPMTEVKTMHAPTYSENFHQIGLEKEPVEENLSALRPKPLPIAEDKIVYVPTYSGNIRQMESEEEPADETPNVLHPKPLSTTEYGTLHTAKADQVELKEKPAVEVPKILPTKSLSNTEHESINNSTYSEEVEDIQFKKRPANGVRRTFRTKHLPIKQLETRRFSMNSRKVEHIDLNRRPADKAQRRVPPKSKSLPITEHVSTHIEKADHMEIKGKQSDEEPSTLPPNYLPTAEHVTPHGLTYSADVQQMRRMRKPAHKARNRLRQKPLPVTIHETSRSGEEDKMELKMKEVDEALITLSPKSVPTTGQTIEHRWKADKNDVNGKPADEVPNTLPPKYPPITEHKIAHTWESDKIEVNGRPVDEVVTKLPTKNLPNIKHEIPHTWESDKTEVNGRPVDEVLTKLPTKNLPTTEHEIAHAWESDNTEVNERPVGEVPPKLSPKYLPITEHAIGHTWEGDEIVLHGKPADEVRSALPPKYLPTTKHEIAHIQEEDQIESNRKPADEVLTTLSQRALSNTKSEKAHGSSRKVDEVALERSPAEEVISALPPKSFPTTEHDITQPSTYLGTVGRVGLNRKSAHKTRRRMHPKHVPITVHNKTQTVDADQIELKGKSTDAVASSLPPKSFPTTKQETTHLSMYPGEVELIELKGKQADEELSTLPPKFVPSTEHEITHVSMNSKETEQIELKWKQADEATSTLPPKPLLTNEYEAIYGSKYSGKADQINLKGKSAEEVPSTFPPKYVPTIQHEIKNGSTEKVEELGLERDPTAETLSTLPKKSFTDNDHDITFGSTYSGKVEELGLEKNAADGVPRTLPPKSLPTTEHEIKYRSRNSGKAVQIELKDKPADKVTSSLPPKSLLDNEQEITHPLTYLGTIERVGSKRKPAHKPRRRKHPKHLCNTVHGTTHTGEAEQIQVRENPAHEEPSTLPPKALSNADHNTINGSTISETREAVGLEGNPADEVTSKLPQKYVPTTEHETTNGPTSYQETAGGLERNPGDEVPSTLIPKYVPTTEHEITYGTKYLVKADLIELKEKPADEGTSSLPPKALSNTDHDTIYGSTNSGTVEAEGLEMNPGDEAPSTLPPKSVLASEPATTHGTVYSEEEVEVLKSRKQHKSKRRMRPKSVPVAVDETTQKGEADQIHLKGKVADDASNMPTKNLPTTEHEIAHTWESDNTEVNERPVGEVPTKLSPKYLPITEHAIGHTWEGDEIVLHGKPADEVRSALPPKYLPTTKHEIAHIQEEDQIESNRKPADEVLTTLSPRALSNTKSEKAHGSSRKVDEVALERSPAEEVISALPPKSFPTTEHEITQPSTYLGTVGRVGLKRKSAHKTRRRMHPKHVPITVHNKTQTVDADQIELKGKYTDVVVSSLPPKSFPTTKQETTHVSMYPGEVELIELKGKPADEEPSTLPPKFVPSTEHEITHVSMNSGEAEQIELKWKPADEATPKPLLTTEYETIYGSKYSGKADLIDLKGKSAEEVPSTFPPKYVPTIQHEIANGSTYLGKVEELGLERDPAAETLSTLPQKSFSDNDHDITFGSTYSGKVEELGLEKNAADGVPRTLPPKSLPTTEHEIKYRSRNSGKAAQIELKGKPADKVTSSLPPKSLLDNEQEITHPLAYLGTIERVGSKRNPAHKLRRRKQPKHLCNTVHGTTHTGEAEQIQLRGNPAHEEPSTLPPKALSNADHNTINGSTNSETVEAVGLEGNPADEVTSKLPQKYVPTTEHETTNGTKYLVKADQIELKKEPADEGTSSLPPKALSNTDHDTIYRSTNSGTVEAEGLERNPGDEAPSTLPPKSVLATEPATTHGTVYSEEVVEVLKSRKQAHKSRRRMRPKSVPVAVDETTQTGEADQIHLKGKVADDASNMPKKNLPTTEHEIAHTWESDNTEVNERPVGEVPTKLSPKYLPITEHAIGHTWEGDEIVLHGKPADEVRSALPPKYLPTTKHEIAHIQEEDQIESNRKPADELLTTLSPRALSNTKSEKAHGSSRKVDGVALERSQAEEVISALPPKSFPTTEHEITQPSTYLGTVGRVGLKRKSAHKTRRRMHPKHVPITVHNKTQTVDADQIELKGKYTDVVVSSLPPKSFPTTKQETTHVSMYPDEVELIILKGKPADEELSTLPPKFVPSTEHEITHVSMNSGEAEQIELKWKPADEATPKPLLATEYETIYGSKYSGKADLIDLKGKSAEEVPSTFPPKYVPTIQHEIANGSRYLGKVEELGLERDPAAETLSTLPQKSFSDNDHDITFGSTYSGKVEELGLEKNAADGVPRTLPPKSLPTTEHEIKYRSRNSGKAVQIELKDKPADKVTSSLAPKSLLDNEQEITHPLTYLGTIERVGSKRKPAHKPRRRKHPKHLCNTVHGTTHTGEAEQIQLRGNPAHEEPSTLPPKALSNADHNTINGSTISETVEAVGLERNPGDEVPSTLIPKYVPTTEHEITYGTKYLVKADLIELKEKPADEGTSSLPPKALSNIDHDTIYGSTNSGTVEAEGLEMNPGDEAPSTLPPKSVLASEPATTHGTVYSEEEVEVLKSRKQHKSRRRMRPKSVPVAVDETTQTGEADQIHLKGKVADDASSTFTPKSFLATELGTKHGPSYSGEIEKVGLERNPGESVPRPLPAKNIPSTEHDTTYGLTYSGRIEGVGLERNPADEVPTTLSPKYIQTKTQHETTYGSTYSGKEEEGRLERNPAEAFTRTLPPKYLDTTELEATHGSKYSGEADRIDSKMKPADKEQTRLPPKSVRSTEHEITYGSRYSGVPPQIDFKEKLAEVTSSLPPKPFPATEHNITDISTYLGTVEKVGLNRKPAHKSRRGKRPKHLPNIAHGTTHTGEAGQIELKGNPADDALSTSTPKSVHTTEHESTHGATYSGDEVGLVRNPSDEVSSTLPPKYIPTTEHKITYRPSYSGETDQIRLKGNPADELTHSTYSSTPKYLVAEVEATRGSRYSVETDQIELKEKSLPPKSISGTYHDTTYGSTYSGKVEEAGLESNPAADVPSTMAPKYRPTSEFEATHGSRYSGEADQIEIKGKPADEVPSILPPKSLPTADHEITHLSTSLRTVEKVGLNRKLAHKSRMRKRPKHLPNIVHGTTHTGEADQIEVKGNPADDAMSKSTPKPVHTTEHESTQGATYSGNVDEVGLERNQSDKVPSTLPPKYIPTTEFESTYGSRYSGAADLIELSGKPADEEQTTLPPKALINSKHETTYASTSGDVNEVGLDRNLADAVPSALPPKAVPSIGHNITHKSTYYGNVTRAGVKRKPVHKGRRRTHPKHVAISGHKTTHGSTFSGKEDEQIRSKINTTEEASGRLSSKPLRNNRNVSMHSSVDSGKVERKEKVDTENEKVDENISNVEFPRLKVTNKNEKSIVGMKESTDAVNFHRSHGLVQPRKVEGKYMFDNEKEKVDKHISNDEFPRLAIIKEEKGINPTKGGTGAINDHGLKGLESSGNVEEKEKFETESKKVDESILNEESPHLTISNEEKDRIVPTKESTNDVHQRTTGNDHVYYHPFFSYAYTSRRTAEATHLANGEAKDTDKYEAVKSVQPKVHSTF